MTAEVKTIKKNIHNLCSVEQNKTTSLNHTEYLRHRLVKYKLMSFFYTDYLYYLKKVYFTHQLNIYIN